MLTRTLCIVALALVALLWPAEARAQSEADKATARALAVEAQKALDAKRYEEAADKFGRADELYHAPTLVVGRARAYVGMGKYVEAMESYNEVIRERLDDDAPKPFKQAKADANEEIEGLDQKIGWVTIQVQGPDDPAVLLDGDDLSVASLGVRRAINPGDHVVKASANGWQSTERSFTIASGGSETVVLELQEASVDVAPLPGPQGGDPQPDGGDDTPADTGDEGGGASTLTILGWTGIGVGGAGLIVGAITGGLAIGKRGELVDNCGEAGECGPEQQSNIDSYRTMGTISTIGFVAGGVLAAAGTVLLIVAHSDDVEAEVGLGHANLRVRF